MFAQSKHILAASTMAIAISLPAVALAQPRDVARIDAGTRITVRTSENIDERSMDGRVYAGVIDESVTDSAGRLAIPRGSAVELVVRAAGDGDLILDLDSVVVNGERYGVRADTTRIDADDQRSGGDGHRTATYAGGGALLGTIIGAITGGGKGAAIGAATGAAAGAGAGILTRGHEIRVPSEALLTFRLERPMVVGVPDGGYDRDQHHYHQYPR
jgi:hypothetical protein